METQLVHNHHLIVLNVIPLVFYGDFEFSWIYCQQKSRPLTIENQSFLFIVLICIKEADQVNLESLTLFQTVLDTQFLLIFLHTALLKCSYCLEEKRSRLYEMAPVANVELVRVEFAVMILGRKRQPVCSWSFLYILVH